MLRSTDRIMTTHAGRLQRPDYLTEAMLAHPRGRPDGDQFRAQLRSAVAEAVREQAELGVDVVSDGEMGKVTWSSYVGGRLGGCEERPLGPGETTTVGGADRRAFPQFFAEFIDRGDYYYKSPGITLGNFRLVCTGPITYIGQAAVQQDIENLRAALQGVDVREAFIPAAPPVSSVKNEFYQSEADLRQAYADAMREEYRAIVDAGFIVQIDDPGLVIQGGASVLSAIGLDAFRRRVAEHVEVVNYALRSIPEHRVRLHVCWGGWHAPHTDDTPFRHVVDLMLEVHAQAYSFEAGNARHAHEWMLWRDVRLPEGKILIPGVVSHTTNAVEQPELVAWRLSLFAGLVGRENVLAGTDCGLGFRAHPEVARAKLQALAEGARLASQQLWA